MSVGLYAHIALVRALRLCPAGGAVLWGCRGHSPSLRHAGVLHGIGGFETASGHQTRYPLPTGMSPRRPALRSPASAPKSSRNQTAATPSTIDTSTDDILSFNHSRSAIPDFLDSLETDDELYSYVSHALSLFTRGYFTEKNVHIVESDKHILHVLRHPDTVFTFKEPSPVGTHTVASEAEHWSSY